MTIEHIMLLASVAQTPRDWAEVRAEILALLDAETQAIIQLLTAPAGADDFRNYCSCKQAIRARIAARKVAP